MTLPLLLSKTFEREKRHNNRLIVDALCVTPISEIFQLYHDDQF